MLQLTRRSARLVGATALLIIATAGFAPARAADDPLANRQWNMTQIHALSAQSVTTGSSIKVGIVDSGVNASHEDLGGRVVAAATCVGTSGSASQCQTGPGAGNDIDGHGTHVAGIIAAQTGNGIGVMGVAPGVQLVVARAFSVDGNGQPTATLNDVRAGIRWVLSQGAKVVNLSIGADESDGSSICQAFGNCSSPLKAAVEEVWQQGALPVIAAGNSQVYSSAGYGDLDAIVVGAVGPADTVTSYSTPIGNAKWGIVAPGGDKPADENNPTEREKQRMILSTYATHCDPPEANNCYAYNAGTSMAAPHVSAVAAMLMARGVGRQATVDTLLSTTDPVECGTNCSGRLNAAKALGVTTTDNSQIAGQPDPTTPTTSRPSSAKKGSSHTTAGTGATTTTLRANFGFDSALTGGRRTTTTFRSQAAIVLNQGTDDEGVPPLVLVVGFGSLAGAALMLSYSLRKTLTTLP